MTELLPLCALELPLPALVGYQDEQLEKGFLDNPYPQDSTQARQWVDGYVQAIVERRDTPKTGYFGITAEHAALLEADCVSTPVGDPCAWCNELIVEGDKGVQLPYSGMPGDTRRTLPFHWECEVRQMSGSVAHQSKLCSCFVKGSTCYDEPSLTRRQAARAAAFLFQTAHARTRIVQ